MKHDNSRLTNLIRAMGALEDGLLVLLLVALLSVAGAQILLRNVWQTGFSWGDPLLRVLVLWLSLLGAMAATRDDNHISIDILSRWLPQHAKTVGRLVTDLFTATVCAVLAYQGARFVLIDREIGAIAFAAVPAWVCELIIPLGFGVMAVRFSLFFVFRLRQLFFH